MGRPRSGPRPIGLGPGTAARLAGPAARRHGHRWGRLSAGPCPRPGPGTAARLAGPAARRHGAPSARAAPQPRLRASGLMGLLARVGRRGGHRWGAPTGAAPHRRRSARDRRSTRLAGSRRSLPWPPVGRAPTRASPIAAPAPCPAAHPPRRAPGGPGAGFARLPVSVPPSLVVGPARDGFRVDSARRGPLPRAPATARWALGGRAVRARPPPRVGRTAGGHDGGGVAPSALDGADTAFAAWCGLSGRPVRGRPPLARAGAPSPPSRVGVVGDSGGGPGCGPARRGSGSWPRAASSW
ncbi:hypothetical protein SAMN04490356_5951 [Streptomyces melanosporofaciens]|uniref:Uncharacterized protein n=1 Tax=Streptomyces melanosporofaciens TaxID=67327 RepID=A0A1H4W7L6_STRMJ|nr:hypothetical protein SAMN04490356_5951 [Streptomyces melanosporofaciens]